MSDHADTIRRLITDWWDCDISKDSEAQALFDWVAERQQAIDERDALRASIGNEQGPLISMGTAGGILSKEVEARKAAEARCEQAIDALRELLRGFGGHDHWREGGSGGTCQTCEFQREAQNKARVALVNLGEKPTP